MDNKTLEQMYAEHVGKVSDKWSIYLAEYGRIFAEYRDSPVRLLEIGIQNGGSLEIWSKYFANAQKLVGCDINPDCARLTYQDPRIAVVVGDANDHATQATVLGHAPVFDVIIDDGSHRSSDIIKSFAKYFPRLADGGVFIVEDIHCSYWQEFEGGLFDPFSSMAFFKRVADIGNYEHWGVEKRRIDVLLSFFSKYGVHIEEEVLQHVHAVEFVNSMCVIRKSKPEHNEMGLRFVAGTEATVVPFIKDLGANFGAALDQSDNHWTARALAPEEELPHRIAEIANLNRVIANLNQVVGEIQNSTSWRISRPVRVAGGQLRRAKYTIKAVRKAINQRGGVGGAITKGARLYRREGIGGIKRAIQVAYSTGQIKPAPGSDSFDRNDYAEWIRRYDNLTDDIRAAMRHRIDTWKNSPLISVVMPTHNSKPEWLIEAIESVRNQTYPNWELCIADDASTKTEVRSILESYVTQDSRIKVTFRERNGHISAASNSALELVTGEWVALLDHDDLLPEHALFWVADTINRNPGARLIYSDEDKIDDKGKRFDPYFKCDWNVDLFYSHNMVSHLGVYSTDLLRTIDGFRSGFEGAQDHDLVLRCIEQISSKEIVHVPRVLYHWRVHGASTAQSTEAKPYAVAAGVRALNEHFQRCGISANAVHINVGYQIRYALPESLPMVSLIIPTRNGLDLIRQCVSSILEKTSYSNYEILIVDNGSDDQATLDYFEKLKSESHIRILRDDRAFNYSALNNTAVIHARGDLIGLINNDIEVISTDWLSELVSHALRPGVGAVGARLWYPNDRLQHGGVVLGVGGVAAHAHKNSPRNQFGYFGRGALAQDFSAVTAACLVIKKTIYEEVGGLNENDLQIAFNDVDFCLRVREAGYRNLWTPFAELYHHESATRGYEDTPEKQARFAKEVTYMKQRWGKLLYTDPAYSPNLTMYDEDFSFAWPPRVGMQI